MWFYKGSHRNPKGYFHDIKHCICENCGQRFLVHKSIGGIEGPNGCSPCDPEEVTRLRNLGIGIDSNFCNFFKELDAPIISEDRDTKDIVNLMRTM